MAATAVVVLLSPVVEVDYILHCGQRLHCLREGGAGGWLVGRLVDGQAAAAAAADGAQARDVRKRREGKGSSLARSLAD